MSVDFKVLRGSGKQQITQKKQFLVPTDSFIRFEKGKENISTALKYGPEIFQVVNGEYSVLLPPEKNADLKYCYSHESKCCSFVGGLNLVMNHLVTQEQTHSM